MTAAPKLSWTRTDTGHTLTADGLPVAHLTHNGDRGLRGTWHGGTYLGSYAARELGRAKRQVEVAYREAANHYS